eukprot:COSAG06_NODE_16804_length_980_cov_0.894438_1_plen_300_part_01
MSPGGGHKIARSPWQDSLERTGKRHRQANNSSEFKGVSWNKSHRKWEVWHRQTYIGGFDDEVAAAKAWDAAAHKSGRRDLNFQGRNGRESESESEEEEEKEGEEHEEEEEHTEVKQPGTSSLTRLPIGPGATQGVFSHAQDPPTSSEPAIQTTVGRIRQRDHILVRCVKGGGQFHVAIVTSVSRLRGIRVQYREWDYRTEWLSIADITADRVRLESERVKSIRHKHNQRQKADRSLRKDISLSVSPEAGHKSARSPRQDSLEHTGKRHRQAGISSRFKGVSWHKCNWRVRLCNAHIGMFD